VGNWTNGHSRRDANQPLHNNEKYISLTNNIIHVRVIKKHTANNSAYILGHTTTTTTTLPGITGVCTGSLFADRN